MTFNCEAVPSSPVEDAAAHGGQHGQHRLACGARAADEDRDVAGVGAVAASRYRAFEKHRTACFDQRSKPDRIGIVGSAHFEPDLARPHRLQETVGPFGHRAAGGRRGEARDNQIDRLAQGYWRRRRFGAPLDIFGYQHIIKIAHSDVVAIANKTSGQLATDISKPDKTDLHSNILSSIAIVFRSSRPVRRYCHK